MTLTVELRLLESLNLADVDVLHRVNALHSLEDRQGDVLGDAAKPNRIRRYETTTTGGVGNEKKKKRTYFSKGCEEVGTIPYLAGQGPTNLAWCGYAVLDQDLSY